MTKIVKTLLAANMCLWIVFAIAFARASYPYSRDVWNYTAPSAPAGYTFFGHSVGVREPAFEHLFFRSMFYVEFPSFVLARITQNILLPHVTGDKLFGGISEGGWRLLAVVLLSFVQWYLVARFVQKIWDKVHPSPRLC